MRSSASISPPAIARSVRLKIQQQYDLFKIRQLKQQRNGGATEDEDEDEDKEERWCICEEDRVGNYGNWCGDSCVEGEGCEGTGG